MERMQTHFSDTEGEKCNECPPEDGSVKGQRGLYRLELLALNLLRVLPGLKEASPEQILAALWGTAWTIAGYGASQAIRLVSTLVLAQRLLAPEAFGLVALVNVFLTGLDMLSDLGIGLDVVQHPRGDDPNFINTAFLIQAGRGVILWAIATALAYPFALFYHQPEVRLLAGVGALSVAIRGIASGSVWLMTRHVQLKKLALLNIGADATGLVVAVAWAIISPTAWALIAGRLAMTAAFTIGSHLATKQRMSLSWDKSAAKSIIVFGTGIFISSSTYFLGGEAERLIIAKFITVAELGCFSLALTLAAVPSQAIGQVAGQVFFPLISRSIRTDRLKATRYFEASRVVFLTLAVILGAGFIAYSNKLVTVLLPTKYAMTGWMLQLLGFRAALQVFAAPTSNLLLACGDSTRGAIANTIRSVSMVIGVWVGFTHYGLRVAVAVLACSYFVAYLVLIPGVRQHLRPALGAEVRGFAVFVLLMAVSTIIPWPGR
jgi:O-antigen/teichoic acid export membrane protein